MPEMDTPTTAVDQGENPEVASRKTSKARVYSKYILPSDRHPFQLHFEVLKRFASRTRNGQEPIESAKVEGEGIPVQGAQMNARFMKDIGLLATGDRGRYRPTEQAVKFVHARTVGEDRAKPILRELLLKTWFAEVATDLFRFDPIMSEDRFVGELALAAETDKNKKEGALRVILEYLVYSGILNRDERGLSLGSGSDAQEASIDASDHTPARDSSKSSPPKDSFNASLGAGRPEAGPEWKILQSEVFHVKVKADLDAVDDLMDYLRILKKSIERKQSKNPVRDQEDGDQAHHDDNGHVA